MDALARDRLALAELLADAFLGGRWRAEDLAERGAGCLTMWPDWMTRLAFALAGHHRVAPIEDRAGLVGLVADFLDAVGADPSGLVAVRELSAPPAWTPLVAQRWPVAQIESVAALAEALELDDGQLAWLADVRGLERTVEAEKLRNYRYRWVPRRSGLPRLIEAPKARLKEIQRWVLREILDHVTPHDAAHGFTRGRSVLTHASQHTGRALVVRVDLRDFFASVSAARVAATFRALGYDRHVAYALTGLCTNAIPTRVWNAIAAPPPHLVNANFWLGRRLASPHLPQGAPTSPALANLAAFALDRRLTGLAAAFELTFTRYADDLVCSGPRLSADANRSLLRRIDAIVTDEGFRIHEAKTSLRSAAQRQLVTGVVVNAHANVTRGDYDRLKAVLHRVAVEGPGSDDLGHPVALQASLRGQVAWVSALNPHRGAKLRRIFDRIDWTAPGRPDG